MIFQNCYSKKKNTGGQTPHFTSVFWPVMFIMVLLFVAVNTHGVFKTVAGLNVKIVVSFRHI